MTWPCGLCGFKLLAHYNDSKIAKIIILSTIHSWVIKIQLSWFILYICYSLVGNHVLLLSRTYGILLLYCATHHVLVLWLKWWQSWHIADRQHVTLCFWRVGRRQAIGGGCFAAVQFVRICSWHLISPPSHHVEGIAIITWLTSVNTVFVFSINGNKLRQG